MSLEIGVSIAGAVLGILGLSLAYISRRIFREHRALLDFLARQNEELEASLSESKAKFEADAKKLSETARRLAWLETRVRQPKAAVEAVVEETLLGVSPKSNVNERRRRVLALASRGQDAGKIASALGMMPGEVELIINLNRLSATL